MGTRFCFFASRIPLAAKPHTIVRFLGLMIASIYGRCTWFELSASAPTFQRKKGLALIKQSLATLCTREAFEAMDAASSR